MSAVAPRELLVIGAGNPLLDISAEVPLDMLEKYGLQLNNAILADEKHGDLYKEMEEKYQVKYINGGATQNAIRVCQGLFGVSNPCTAYMGCIGTDSRGKIMKENLASEGVLSLYAESDKNPTGTCAVLVHGGERSLVANIAAANDFPLDHLRFKVWDHVEAAKICYSASFFLTVCPPAMVAMAEHCCKMNKTYCLNLAAPFLVEFFKDPMMAVMPYVDFLFGNESEAEVFGRVHGMGSSIEEIAVKMCRLPKANSKRGRTVVITQGSNHTLVATTWAGFGVKVIKFPVEPLEKSKIVDTNGAGDAFVGGFLYGLARDKPLDSCIFWGHYAARHKLQRAGCTFDFKDKPEDV